MIPPERTASVNGGATSATMAGSGTDTKTAPLNPGDSSVGHGVRTLEAWSAARAVAAAAHDAAEATYVAYWQMGLPNNEAAHLTGAATKHLAVIKARLEELEAALTGASS